MEGLGAGLAALAFWGFLAAVVVAGIWYSVREKEAQHETMRRIVESGQPIDEKVIEKVFRGDSRPDRDLKIAAMIVIACAPGLAVLGWFLSFISEQALMPLLGVAGLVGFVGIGLWVASKIAERAYLEDESKASGRTMAP
jgi:hypothetical protein